MARLWWTLDPSKYYLKQVSSGGRNEILFTLLGISAGYWYFGKQRCQTYWRRKVDNCQNWCRAKTLCGQDLVVPYYL